MISDFEQGLGQYAYTYVDNTAAISPSGYQQPTELGQHCVDDPGHNVFHAHGGPFLGWGGGFGVAMQHIVQTNCVGSPLPDYCIPPGAQPEVTGLYLDASQWDGVAVWARRGASGQPLLRVLIGNKYTDDDISFTMYNYYPNEPRYCERIRECACINGLQCTFSQDQDHGGPVGVMPGGGYYCGTPGIVSGPDVMAAGDTQHDTNTCNTTRCDDPYPAYPNLGVDNTHPFGSDPAFANRPCRPFTFRQGITTSVCYGDNDPLPAQTDQQCGDHWTYPLTLTTDWQLFLVPFNWMYQQGFAKRFTSFDLKSVSVARFTWDAGPVDFYVDNWRFYRVKRPRPTRVTERSGVASRKACRLPTRSRRRERGLVGLPHQLCIVPSSLRLTGRYARCRGTSRPAPRRCRRPAPARRPGASCRRRTCTRAGTRDRSRRCAACTPGCRSCGR